MKSVSVTDIKQLAVGLACLAAVSAWAQGSSATTGLVKNANFDVIDALEFTIKAQYGLTPEDDRLQEFLARPRASSKRFYAVGRGYSVRTIPAFWDNLRKLVKENKEIFPTDLEQNAANQALDNMQDAIKLEQMGAGELAGILEYSIRDGGRLDKLITR